MTKTEKAVVYDEVVRFIQEGIALEKHYLSKGKNSDAIQFARANAYGKPRGDLQRDGAPDNSHYRNLFGY
jgi:hypothetical protein